MLGRYRNSFAEINLQNLEQNYQILSQMAQGAGLIPMVKADAYGHGDVHVSRVLEKLGARYLGVALIEEGIKLRLNGIQMPILVFGFFDSIGADALIKYRLTPVLSEMSQFDYLKTSLHDGASYPVHIKFNTGMHRLGFEESDAKQVAEYFEQATDVKLEGVCSHFVSSQMFDQQEASFQKIIKTLKQIHNVPFLTHISNSAALAHGLKHKYDLVRPGISLYGYGQDHVLPVMELKSNISLIRKVNKGQTVSYGATWTANHESLIAVIPLGYADGISRALSNKGNVIINGEKCPVRGIICMDYFMVDITHLKQQAVVGDEVVIIGKQKNIAITAEDIAKEINTISYEILTGIRARVPRVYVH